MLRRLSTDTVSSKGSCDTVTHSQSADILYPSKHDRRPRLSTTPSKHYLSMTPAQQDELGLVPKLSCTLSMDTAITLRGVTGNLEW